MLLLSDIFVGAPQLVEQVYFKRPGSASKIVPATAKFVRAHALGCGGQGENWGGGGALARSTRAVTPGETLNIQVGDVSTASSGGDSWVKFATGGGIICYADRGRGNGTQGLASNSIGDVTRSGNPYNSPLTGGGAPASDAGDLWSVFGEGVGAYVATGTNARYATAGGGGINIAQYNESDSSFTGYLPYGAGFGRVCLQFFTAEPGLGL